MVGKDLSSLRQLRISRDKNVCREPEEMSVEGFFGGGALPKLERFTVDATRCGRQRIFSVTTLLSMKISLFSVKKALNRQKVLQPRSSA